MKTILLRGYSSDEHRRRPINVWCEVYVTGPAFQLPEEGRGPKGKDLWFLPVTEAPNMRIGCAPGCEKCPDGGRWRVVGDEEVFYSWAMFALQGGPGLVAK